MTPEKNDATVLVRLPSDLKHALQREAYVNGRRITAEINIRLANSLKEAGAIARPIEPLTAREPSPTHRAVEMEEQLLRAFRKLSPEKQLALLALLS